MQQLAAFSGGLLAPHLADGSAQFTILITGYVLWAYSVPVALSILVILLLRMTLRKLPHESMAASSWLSLGPIGTGALGMLVLGQDASAIFTAHGMAAEIGSVAEGIGLVTTLKRGPMLQMASFDVMGVVLVLMLIIMWVIVAAKTLAGVYRSNLCVSPCIASLCKAEAEL